MGIPDHSFDAAAGRAAPAAARAAALSALLDSTTRLYRLDAEGELTGLQVEAFALDDALGEPWRLELSLLHPRADLDLEALLARPASLVSVLADGSEHRRSGLVLQAAAEESDGGLARYRLTLQPWLGFLAQTFRSFVWQDKTATQIVDSVLARYSRLGHWRWSSCALQLLAQAHQGGLRSYCVQYRESDLDFISRLLAEEGIGYRFEEAAGGPPGSPGSPGSAHTAPAPTVVFFADSSSAQSMPEDASSASAAGGRGIRFHGDGAHEQQDTVQAFGGVRSQPIAVVTAVSYDYKSGRLVGVEVPTLGSVGGQHALRLEAYDSSQGYAFANSADAERALRLKQQALEARHKVWLGRGGVRSFGAGSTFCLTESLLDGLDGQGSFASEDDKRFLLTRVTAVGINNLPKETNERLAASRSLRREARDLLPGWVEPELLSQAAGRGYANTFEAIRAKVPWRPLRTDASGPGAGAKFNPKPTVPGPLTATVVGPDGSRHPRGAQEVHTDRMGRVLIRYDFQDQADEDDAADSAAAGVCAAACAPASTWVRVLQPLAGDGCGTLWTPRIGHEVLVGHFDDDIDRPYIICSLYNGRGEGGLPPTPGGQLAAGHLVSDRSVFARSTDARPAGQGNLTGGNSPAWHGASPGELAGSAQGGGGGGGGSGGGAGQRNAAALSGYKTREFGGAGFNQLVFDDSTAQLRLQLATTQHASQLNLGHLIHQADNHRGSFRGLGWELRTDAYGAVRGGQGVLLSTYATNASDPAGDNAAGIALARQWNNLAGIFDRATLMHRTVRLSGMIGTTGAGRSVADDRSAPIAAWLKHTSGMVSGEGLEAAQADAAKRSTSTGNGKLPHTSDAVVSVSARAGLAMVAGQDAVLAAEENVQLGSAADVEVAAGGALRLHTGQAIGLLAGAIEAGEEAVGTGLTMIAGAGDIEVQAQAGELQVAALADVVLQSERAGIDLAAAKKITLSTAGGASIVIEGGNVTFECPGRLTIRAGRKSFVGPVRVDRALPVMPHQVCIPCLLEAAAAGNAFAFAGAAHPD